MAWFRLKDAHPTMKVLENVFQQLHDAGINIEIGAYGMLIVHHDGKTYKLLDNESPPDNDMGCGNIPPMLEYKLVYESDE